MAFDTLFSSYLEHEVQAAWMGLGMFGTVGIILIIVGEWQYSKNI